MPRRETSVPSDDRRPSRHRSSPPPPASAGRVDNGIRGLSPREDRAMIRLSASALPLWRDDGRVQFGAPPLAVTPYPAGWVDVLVGALVEGTTRAAARNLGRLHGAPEGHVDDLLAAIAPACRTRRRHRPISVQIADDLPSRAVRAVLAALPARAHILPWAGSASETVPSGTAVVLVGAYRIEPRRAATFMRDDITHVPLVLDGGRARIGPVVRPGRTACLTCIDTDQRRGDPSWPVVAAQLLGRPRPDVDVALAAEAGRAARFLLTAPSGQVTRSLRLDVDSFRRVWELHRPSADCHCRSLAENATATAPSVRSLEPSSPTACAPPA